MHREEKVMRTKSATKASKGSLEMKVVLDENAIMPERAHETDAGLDLMAPDRITLPARSECKIDTGVHIELPPNTVGFVKSRSGLNFYQSIQTEGVIDEGYTGSIHVKLYNHSNAPYYFNRGDKIAQLVVLPCLYVSPVMAEELEQTDRGEDGFGSTDKLQ